MKKLAESIVKLRIPIVIITFMITIILGYFIKDIKVNSDILSYLPEDDNAAALFNSVGKKYGGNDMAIIAIQSDDIFQKDVLERIKQLTDSRKVLDGIGTVTSLTDVIGV